MDVRNKYRHLKEFITNHAELQMQEMTSVVQEINDAGLTDQETLVQSSKKLHVMQGRGEIINAIYSKIKELEK
tara:strand:+ start:873 stop:1091 length:219 start_codon:yes stop_codon:yes gene_type:complete